VEHELFQNHAQPARSYLAGHGLARDRPQGIIGKLQPYVLELKQPLVLLDDGILRPGQDFDQRVLVEILQHAHDGQSAYKLRNQSELDQIFRLDFGQQLLRALLRGDRIFLVRIFASAETQRLLADSAGDDLVETHESSATNEQDVRGVDRREFLVRMLAPALRRDVGDRAFQNLQQRLLHAFAGNIARDRRILVLA